MTKLKLFVWTEFAPDYTDGLAFAIAKTEKEAKKIISEKVGWEPYVWGPVTIKNIESCGYFVYGGG